MRRQCTQPVMGRTMQSAVALVAKRLFADLRLSAWRTAHRDSAAASPQGVLAALEPTATVSARPASVTWLTEEKQMWPPSIRTFWWSRGNKSASTVAAIHPPCVCHRSQDTGAPARNAGNTQGTALKQYPDVRCYSTWHGQPAQEEGPNISRLDPALQQQWDHAANAHLGPIDIKSKSSKKVWWICGQCPDGHLHTWEASVSNRASGTGCPQCVGRKVCKHNSLATKAPQVAAQWDYEANKGIPDGVVAQSSQPVGWRCDVCGHQWSAEPGQRVSKKKAGCPECAIIARSKKTKYPTLAECQEPRSKAVLADWDHERNSPQGYFPHNTTLRSSKQIFWLCSKCPAGQQHGWSATPNKQNCCIKSGCPFCAGMAACRCNSLQVLYPAIAAQWDHSKNAGQPSDYTAGSSYLAWWFNSQRGSWQQTVNSRITSVRRRSASSKRQRLDSASPSKSAGLEL